MMLTSRRGRPVYHLPAYVAAERWSADRSVVVIAPQGPEGVARLAAAGARDVCVVGGPDTATPIGVRRQEGVPTLPLGEGSADVALCIEGYGDLEDDVRRRLLREAARVLSADGLFVAWIPYREQADGPDLDFWTMEDELSAVFPEVYIVAQIPWHGFSLAPVLDEGDPRLVLQESLLAEAPEATHYMAVGCKGEPPQALLDECVLVPVPGLGSAARAAEGAEDEASSGIPPEMLAALEERIRDLEQLAQTARSAAERRGEELDAVRAEVGDRDDELGNLRKRVGERETELTAVRQDLERRDRELKSSREALESLRRDLEGARAHATRAEADAEKTVQSLRTGVDREQERMEGDLRMARGEVERLRGQLGQSQTQLAENRARLETLREELESRDAREAGAHDRVRELELKLESLQSSSVSNDQLIEARKSLEEERARREQIAAELEQQVRAKETDLAILTRTNHDQDTALARLTERVEEQRKQAESAAAQERALQNRCQALVAEQGELARQLDVAIAEREAARQLAARLEADLDMSRKRVEDREQQLATKLEEASRLGGELQALRERVQHQETTLAQTRSRAEELTAEAAQSAEQGRLMADVALDRDRLREELSRRATQLQAMEERLWQAQEELQKERVDHSRLAGEAERLREQVERSHASEIERGEEVEQLSAELRKAEVEQANLAGLLKSRDQELLRLEQDVESLSSDSADLEKLREELSDRSKLIAELQIELEQGRARERDAQKLAEKRAGELRDAGDEMLKLKRHADETAGLAAGLQNELDVKEVEARELRAAAADLHKQLDVSRERGRALENDRVELQRKVEESASRQELLRRKLREREQDLEDMNSSQQTSGVEIDRLRMELEAAARANEQLESALHLGMDPSESGEAPLIDESWPGPAVAEIRRLRAELATQARAHSAELTTRVTEARNASLPAGERDRIRRLALEAKVRGAEQEYLLSELDAAEQKIWEMTDESDRNAARLAAGLAQLEKHREKLDETADELEVTRRLLAAEQARALEQERLLASERAKLARAGLGPGGLPDSGPGDMDEVFDALNRGMVDLDQGDAGGAGAPVATIHDRADSGGSKQASTASRMVVEQADDEDDEPWPGPAGAAS